MQYRVRLSALIIGLLLAGDPAPATAQETTASAQNVQQLLATAEGHLNTRNWNAAIAVCNGVLSKQPGNVQALSKRAIAFNGKGEFDKSLADYSAALQRTPNDAMLLTLRAGVYGAGKRDFAAAQRDLSKAIESNSRFDMAYALRGNNNYLMGNSLAAIADYTEAIRLAPSNASYYAGRAGIFKKTADFVSAIRDYEQAAKLDPNSPEAFNDAAWLQATCPDDRARDGKAAITNALSACELTKYKNANYLATLAAAYAEAGDLENAVTWQYGAIDIALPASKAAMQQRAKLYEQHKPYRDAGLAKVAGKVPTFIDRQIKNGWTANGLVPSEPATDNEWCRRLYLDLLGRVPTVDELDKFLSDTSPTKKSNLVDRLLGEDYGDDYARNWAGIWTNILIGRAGGTEPGTLIDREGMRQALHAAFQRNMPYDQLVSELISAQGVGKPGQPNYNGLVNFLIGDLARGGIEATAKTAQTFLGIQIRCTQCHNSPFNARQQDQFWQMNAFFLQARTRFLTKPADAKTGPTAELLNETFQGVGSDAKDAASYFETRGGIKTVYPVFVDGTKLATHSGRIEDVDRRLELAKLVVNSENMRQAIVNRMWSHFLGYGFTRPIDDMGAHKAPTHPELLDGLAENFKQSRYDLKELIRWIVLSEAYSLASRYGIQDTKDDPSSGTAPMFSRFYLRQMQPEELYESLATIVQVPAFRDTFEYRKEGTTEWIREIVIAFDTDEHDETTSFDGGVSQTAMMMNGQLTKAATSIDSDGFLQKVAADGRLDNAGKVAYLFKAGVSRDPTELEIKAANSLAAGRSGDVVGLLQDVWWSILNSNEFILNH